jgi:alpha-L-rhamnosidase
MTHTPPDGWTASWIEPEEAGRCREVQRPAYHLASCFKVDEVVRRASLWFTAHGIVEVFVNGVRVGEDELLPGFTAYRKRLEVHAFDVTDQIVPGDNALGALLSDGWWRGQHSSARRTDSYGSTTGLLAELHLELASGAVMVVATDGSWRSTPSHILAADIIAGEVHDLRRRVVDWCKAGVDRASWDPVRLANYDNGRLSLPLGPPCRRVEELKPVAIRELQPGRHVVDLGQNINGWVRLTDLGPADAELRLTHGEALDADGDVTQRNVSHADRFPERPFQTDVVVSAGDGSIFEPRHSTKGFQYVRIEGHPGPLRPEAVTGVVVRSVLQPAGGFSCSDERLNRLHAAADWSFRDNTCCIPTDCPSRERAGWTGDYQTFIETAAYLYDVADFSLRWLHDMAAEQWADGAILNYVPDPHDFTLEENARWRSAQGSAGWGDAACHVPWELYRATGRAEPLRPLLGMMRGWVDFALRRAQSGRHPDRAAARSTPLPHERYIWDTGFHFGEWAEPEFAQDPAAAFAKVLKMDHGPTATAFLHRSADELARLSLVLGDAPAAEHYAEVAERVREAWCAEFLDAQGRVQPQTQANLVRALAFGLVPAEFRPRAADDLVALVRAADTHLGTGFLATPFLLSVLADHGHLDVAYELLLQSTAPSWLHMIDQGATTIWELWTGVDGRGEGSLNHYSKGSVVSYLHRYVAGLQIVEPGYRRFRVAPRPGGGITSASTWHESPFGRISVAWQIEGGRGEVQMSVPAGAIAEVELPDGGRCSLGAGQHVRSWPSATS